MRGQNYGSAVFSPIRHWEQHLSTKKQYRRLQIRKVFEVLRTATWETQIWIKPKVFRGRESQRFIKTESQEVVKSRLVRTVIDFDSSQEIFALKES